jgi:hypothetical protein
MALARPDIPLLTKKYKGRHEKKSNHVVNWSTVEIQELESQKKLTAR